MTKGQVVGMWLKEWGWGACFHLGIIGDDGQVCLSLSRVELCEGQCSGSQKGKGDGDVQAAADRGRGRAVPLSLGHPPHLKNPSRVFVSVEPKETCPPITSILLSQFLILKPAQDSFSRMAARGPFSQQVTCSVTTPLKTEVRKCSLPSDTPS